MNAPPPRRQALRIAQLEISLRRTRDYAYDVELRFAGPDDDADTRRSGSTLSDEALRELALLDPLDEEYGRRLFSGLFTESGVLTAFREALAITENEDAALRIRLLVDPASPELHRLRWEALRDAETGALLFTGDRIYFSRYISSPVYKALRRRPREDLKVLVMIASPSDLDQWQPNGQKLAPIDAAEEEKRIRGALGNNIQVRALSRGESPETGLQALSAALESEAFDVLYLVCHGALIEHEPRLWLERADGTADVVPGVDFVQRLAELRNRPSLVVLASCQSAGEGDGSTDDVLASVGALLAQAGVPAVLAMQGNVTMSTVGAFMPVFFGELAENGQIDRAVALARGRVRDHRDAWVPVLFMRLKGGGLWYERGFLDSPDGFRKWPALVASIRTRRCTPILGPGLVEPLVGSRRELARDLADYYGFPMATHEREDLPQVAQFVAVEQSKSLVDWQIIALLCRRIQNRYADVIDADLRDADLGNLSDTELAQTYVQLLSAARQYRCRAQRTDPYEVLAKLPFRLYINTDVDPLMQQALASAATAEKDPAKRREPNVVVYRWNSALENQKEALRSEFDENPKYEPVDRAPVIYHLFGSIEVQDSLVTTQDDYFDALISASGSRPLPIAIRKALTNGALLFIGFQIDDWNFRVLFRFLMNLEGAELLQRHPHVAVQIDPEEQRFANPSAARRYLARFFGDAAKISIYWGSAEDFTRELQEQYLKLPPSIMAATPGAAVK